jgi:hypothetical protein
MPCHRRCAHAPGTRLHTGSVPVSRQDVHCHACRRQGLPDHRGAGIAVCRACRTGPVPLLTGMLAAGRGAGAGISRRRMPPGSRMMAGGTSAGCLDRAPERTGGAVLCALGRRAQEGAAARRIASPSRRHAERYGRSADNARRPAVMYGFRRGAAASDRDTDQLVLSRDSRPIRSPSSPDMGTAIDRSMRFFPLASRHAKPR